MKNPTIQSTNPQNKSYSKFLGIQQRLTIWMKVPQLNINTSRNVPEIGLRKKSLNPRLEKES